MVVPVDGVFEQKLKAIDQLVSQAYEGGAGGSVERAARVPEQPQARLAWLRTRWARRQAAEADRYRDVLLRLFGEQRGKSIKFAEAFELCEYGHRPSAAELRTLFPFFDR